MHDADVSSNPPAPSAEKRLPALDLIRGIAILMILPANISSFSGVEGWDPRCHVAATPLDQTVVLLTRLFVDGRFVTLFSILFGAGLALQVDRARAAGTEIDRYYVRRMLILFGIGTAH